MKRFTTFGIVTLAILVGLFCADSAFAVTGLRVVGSTSLVSSGQDFTLDVVAEGVPVEGLGGVQFRLNMQADSGSVVGVENLSLAAENVISLASPLLNAPPSTSASGIGDFFWNARGSNGVLFSENQTLTNGSALFTFAHTFGSVHPSGSGSVARFLVHVGTGVKPGGITVSLTDVVLLDGGAAYPLDYISGTTVQIPCTATVPSLIGLTRIQAESALAAANLTPGTVNEIHTSFADGKFGIVREQSAVSGTTLYCNTAASPSYVYLTINTPLADVTGLSASDKAGDDTGKLLLSWTAVQSSGVTGYRIYRTSGKIADVAGSTATGVELSGLPNGVPQDLRVVTVDANGNESPGVVVSGTALDDVFPLVDVSGIINGTFYKDALLTVRGTATDTNGVSVNVNGIPATNISQTDGSFSLGVPLVAGVNILSVTATDPSGNRTFVTQSVNLDITPPTLAISSLADGAYTNNATLNVSGITNDVESGIKSLTIKGVDVTSTILASDGSFTHPVTLVDGSNIIETIVTDNVGNSTINSRTITLDTTAPTVTITAPVDNSLTNQGSVTVTVSVSKPATVQVRVNNGSWQTAQFDGTSHGILLSLSAGQNTIEATATDLAQNVAITAKSTVTYDNAAPQLAVIDPSQDITTAKVSFTLTGTVNDQLSATSISISHDGQTFAPTITNGVFSQQISFTTAKTYPVVVTAADAAGNSVSVTRNIIFSPYVVTFSAGSNGIITGNISQTVAESASSTAVTAIPDPGYHFDKWSSTSGFTATDNPLTIVNISTTMTITANFVINSYSVIFNSNGGSTVSSQNVIENAPATVPVAPVRNGYVFSGWYGDSALTSPFNFSSAITVDTTLYARWMAEQIITFPLISAKTYGSADFGAAASASSALPITYTSDTPSVATITPAGLVHITGAGSAVITASQAGNSLYNPAVEVRQKLTVNKAVLTVAAQNVSSSAGAVSSVQFLATYSGFVYGETTAVLSGTPKFSTPATDTSASGSYPITPVVGSLAAANYSFIFSDGTLAVGLITQNIIFKQIPDRTYGTAAIDLSSYVTAGASGTPLTFAVSSGPGSVNGTLLSVSGVGDIIIAASQAGTSSYASAVAWQTVKVNPAVITVSAVNASRLTGEVNPVFTETYSGFVNKETAADALTGAPLLSTTATASSPQGSYPIVVSIGTLAAVNYTFSFVDAYLAVGVSSQNITFDAIAAKTYGDAGFALTALSSSGLPVLFESSNPAVATITAATVTIIGAGTTQITAIQTGDSVFAPARAQQVLTVNPAALIVTANNATRSYGSVNPSLTPSYSGFVNGDIATVLLGSPVLSSSALIASPVGTYPIIITANNLMAANYTLNFVPGVLEITRAKASISLGGLSHNYDGSAKSATATTDPPGMTVTFTYDNSVVLPVNVGSYAVIATISDSNYEGTVSGTLVINDSTAPLLTVSTLDDGAVTNNTTLNVSGTVSDIDSGIKSLTVNGKPAAVAGDGSFSVAITLVEGLNTIAVTATNNANIASEVKRTVHLMPSAPVLNVSTPVDNSKTAQSLVTVSGTVSETSTVTIKLNSDTPKTPAVSGSYFSDTVNLVSGLNTISITAKDPTGNTSRIVRTVIYNNAKPSVAITSPGHDIAIGQNSITIRGAVTGSTLATTTVSISFNNQTFTPVISTDSVDSGTFSHLLTIPTEGNYAVTVLATDKSGNSCSTTRNIIYTVPATTVDTTAPDVSVHLPTSTAAKTIDINKSYYVTATDNNTGIEGYLMSTSAATPAAADTRWQTTEPQTYYIKTWGNNVIYTFAKDRAGNISAPVVTEVFVGSHPDADGVIVQSSGNYPRGKREPTLEDALISLKYALGILKLAPGDSYELRHGKVAPLENGVPNPVSTRTELNLGDTIIILRRVVGL